MRLIGRAQSVFQHLSDDRKDTCEHAMEALHQWFELASKRELYLTELSTRRQRPTKSWANFANDLRRLPSKAYPDPGQKATDQLALTHYLMALTDVQIALQVLSAEFYFHKPITVHLELYLFYRFIHFLLYIGQY